MKISLLHIKKYNSVQWPSHMKKKQIKIRRYFTSLLAQTIKNLLEWKPSSSVITTLINPV